MNALRVRLVALVLACVLALGACAAREHDSPGVASEWLDLVQREHARADEALAAGDADRARAALRAALDVQVPHSIRAEHRRVVHQDLWFRLATLDAGARPAEALLEAERGLSLGRNDDIFTSNLLAARARALAAVGRDTEAASSYHEALEIDERLLHAALGRGQAGGP
jgi:tetratricopeptide (TPR) repeat protein